MRAYDKSQLLFFSRETARVGDFVWGAGVCVYVCVGRFTVLGSNGADTAEIVLGLN